MVLNENNGTLGMKYKVKGIIYDKGKIQDKFNIIIIFYSINKLEVQGTNYLGTAVQPVLASVFQSDKEVAFIEGQDLKVQQVTDHGA